MTVSPLPPATIYLLLFGLGLTSSQQTWSNFNCPAPRSPKNGLSFIFQQGKEVHFKCLPGYALIGNPVATCLNNFWDSNVPDCIPDKGDNFPGKEEWDEDQLNEASNSGRPLFSWESPKSTEKSPQSEFVAGSRRLPLINGLLKSPSTQGYKVSAAPNQTDQTFGRQANVVNRSRNHYDQELSIAEVRQRQQEDVLMNSVLRGSEHFPRGPPRREHPSHVDDADRRRWRIVQARQSPNIQYAGSRAASAYRGETDEDNDLDSSGTLMGMFNWAEAPRQPSEIHIRQHIFPPSAQRPEVSNDELIEMRQRQIAEALRNQMAANLPRGSNSDKAGLVEDARRRQYEDLQLLRNQYKQTHVVSNSGARRYPGNYVTENQVTVDDYLVPSGTEQHENIVLSDDDIKSGSLKPVVGEQRNIFKPVYYEDIQDNVQVASTTSPARGDMGVIASEYPELIDYKEQYPTAPLEDSVNYNLPVSDLRPHRTTTFSAEKAAQVDATFRRFLRPQPGVIFHSVYQQPPTVPTYHSNLVPKVTRRPVPTRPPYRPTTFRPSGRPPVREPTRAPVMEANGDKAAQTEEALYQQYLQAEHMRRIMEYERERLEWERRRELERRYIMEEERQREANRRSALAEENREEGIDNEVVQRAEEVIHFSNTSDADLDYANRVAVLASIDREWLSQLSPDLQARYLEEILTSRRKESDESQHAEDFLRRHLDNSIHNTTFPNVSTRTSASGHVTTIIESKTAASPNGTGFEMSFSKADMSCLQSRSGRRLFIRAPKVPFAYVHRYERKKHPNHPFKQYLGAEYRCRRGFTMTAPQNDSLFCRRMEWVGEKPHCVKAA